MTRGKKYDIRRNAGDNNEEEIPVPMPNTEVKLLSAEDTYELPCWENRKLPVFLFKKGKKGKRHSSLAQLVEQLAVNQWVVSSSLTGGAMKIIVL